MMELSQKIQRCNLSPMRKFHPLAVAAEQQGKRIYHLNIGQPDIDTPNSYFQAARIFKADVLAYAPSPGMPELIAAIQTYYAGLGVSYGENEILITAGGSEALLFTLLCLLNDGDEVLIPEPFYPNYHTFVCAAGGSIRPIPTSPEEGYRFADRSRIEACITDRTRAILFSNPGNPTGVVLSKEELQLLADIALEHDLFLIGDEVYREFVYDGHTSSTIASMEYASDHIILIDSVSKRFSACGARVGCMISRNQELMAEAMKLCQARLSVATLDQISAAALYTADEQYFEDVRQMYQQRRDLLLQKLQNIPGLRCVKPQGAFYLMAQLPITDAEDFQKWLLTEFSDADETLMFSPGASFYATPGCGRNEVRMAYVLQCEDLMRAADLLAMGLERYQNRPGSV